MTLKKCIKYLEYIILFILIFTIAVLYLNHKWDILYNSDTMFLAQLFENLTHHGKYLDWLIPTTPMYFPDWCVFLIAFILSKNIYIQFLIYSILNTLLLYLVIRFIYKEFYSINQSIVFALTSISVFLFLAMNVISPYVLLLVPVQHVGTFIIGLFYLYCQLELLNFSNPVRNNWLVCSLVILAVIMGVSDLLFIIEFIFTIFLVHFLMFFNKQISLQNLIKLSLLPLTGSVIGVLLLPYIMPKTILWAYLDHPSISKISLLNLNNRLDFIKNCFKGIFFSYPILIYVYLIFYSTIIIALIYAFLKIRFNKKFFLTKKNIFINLFILITIVSNICAFIVLPNQVFSTQRYIEPIFFIPITLFFLIFTYFKKTNKILKILTIFSMIFLGYLTFLNTHTIFKKFSNLKKNYYTKELECIDNAIKDEGTRGISDYWTARPISLFSRKKLIVQAFNENLSPFLMLSDISKFTNNYTFAIIHNGFPVEEVLKLYNGNPNKIMNCGEKKIFIYNQDAFKIPCFTRKGYQFTWPATGLPSRLSMSRVSMKKKRIAKEIEGENFLSFGPYIVLPEGHYHFSVRYSSSNSTSMQVGVCDVFTIINGILLQKPIFGTNKKVKNINGEFFVNHSMAYTAPFEIRVYFLGKGDLEFEALTIERA